jgi:predicted Fe-Mo cluster-binding NifX family protein
MKIAVASNNGVNVTGHLGRCRGFIIYETDGEKVISKEYRENIFTHHMTHGHSEGHAHGEGNHSHSALVEGIKDCSAILFNSGGWRVVEDLKSNNIYPFLTDETDAEKAVMLYLKNELIEMKDNTCSGH